MATPLISPGSLTPQGIATAAKDGGVPLITVLLLVLLGAGGWKLIDVLERGFDELADEQRASTLAQQETTTVNQLHFGQLDASLKSIENKLDDKANTVR